MPASRSAAAGWERRTQRPCPCPEQEFDRVALLEHRRQHLVRHVREATSGHARDAGRQRQDRAAMRHTGEAEAAIAVGIDREAAGGRSPSGSGRRSWPSLRRNGPPAFEGRGGRFRPLLQPEIDEDRRGDEDRRVRADQRRRRASRRRRIFSTSPPKKTSASSASSGRDAGHDRARQRVVHRLVDEVADRRRLYLRMVSRMRS